jgi:hypothetical protein
MPDKDGKVPGLLAEKSGAAPPDANRPFSSAMILNLDAGGAASLMPH